VNLTDRFYKFARRLAEALDIEKVDYAFTGAFAVSAYGSPRTTSDLDIMVLVAGNAEARRKLETALKSAGLDVGNREIDTALTSGFNIATFKDKASAYTVDVIFSAKLEKQPATVQGVKTFLQSPEGLVAAKLRMIKATEPRERAAKDMDDVRAILAFTKVDLARVRKQAAQDHTLSIFEALISS
jgi:hypothetical protein